MQDDGVRMMRRPRIRQWGDGGSWQLWKVRAIRTRMRSQGSTVLALEQRLGGEEEEKRGSLRVAGGRGHAAGMLQDKPPSRNEGKD